MFRFHRTSFSFFVVFVLSYKFCHLVLDQYPHIDLNYQSGSLSSNLTLNPNLYICIFRSSVYVIFFPMWDCKVNDFGVAGSF